MHKQSSAGLLLAVERSRVCMATSHGTRMRPGKGAQGRGLRAPGVSHVVASSVERHRPAVGARAHMHKARAPAGHACFRSARGASYPLRGAGPTAGHHGIKKYVQTNTLDACPPAFEAPAGAGAFRQKQGARRRRGGPGRLGARREGADTKEHPLERALWLAQARRSMRRRLEGPRANLKRPNGAPCETAAGGEAAHNNTNAVGGANLFIGAHGSRSARPQRAWSKGPERISHDLRS